MNFDRFLEPDECKPRPDSEGDPINCLECDETGCDFWEEIHSRYESDKWKELNEEEEIPADDIIEIELPEMEVEE